jgi:hypothetical protein
LLQGFEVDAQSEAIEEIVHAGVAAICPGVAIAVAGELVKQNDEADPIERFTRRKISEKFVSVSHARVAKFLEHG